MKRHNPSHFNINLVELLKYLILFYLILFYFCFVLFCFVPFCFVLFCFVFLLCFVLFILDLCSSLWILGRLCLRIKKAFYLPHSNFGTKKNYLLIFASNVFFQNISKERFKKKKLLEFSIKGPDSPTHPLYGEKGKKQAGAELCQAKHSLS